MPNPLKGPKPTTGPAKAQPKQPSDTSEKPQTKPAEKEAPSKTRSFKERLLALTKGEDARTKKLEGKPKSLGDVAFGHKLVYLDDNNDPASIHLISGKYDLMQAPDAGEKITYFTIPVDEYQDLGL